MVEVLALPTVQNGTMTESHYVACFVRVDLKVAGEPASDLYDAIGEELQDGIQDFLLNRQARLDLDFMTCRVLGPLSTDDLVLRDDPDSSMFEPLLEYLEHGPA
jgi:hypothetical protein